MKNRKKLNIWLVQRAEPLPLDEGRQKLMRTGMLARILSERGHKVLWWTSCFDHYRKEHRSEKDLFVNVAPGYRICMLKGPGYEKNISLRRLYDQRVIADRFARLSREQARPDLILSSLPSIDLCQAALEYGVKNGVPVVIDVRDMYPDIFLDIFPGYFRPAAKAILFPLFKQAGRICVGAAGITGVTEEFVEWGLEKCGRARAAVDRSFPLGHELPDCDDESIRDAALFWDDFGIKQNGSFVVSFVGSVSSQFDLGTTIKAVRACAGEGMDIKLVVCGTGDKLDHYRKIVGRDSNVVFAGWADAPRLKVLMKRSSLGLDPLPENRNFLSNVNNKAIEYLGAGVPVLSSPEKGVLYRLLRDNGCGASYAAGDEDGLSVLLRELAQDKNRLEVMSRKAVELYEKRFRADKVYNKMAKHLELIADQAQKKVF